MKGSYADIIHMPHHVSTKHPQMSLHDRAAQFAPFAALTGHEDNLKETARQTEEFLELDEYEKEEIDRKLRYLIQHREKEPEVTVVYYVPDTVKTGGSYRRFCGKLKKMDEYKGILEFRDGVQIPISSIYNLTFPEEEK